MPFVLIQISNEIEKKMVAANGSSSKNYGLLKIINIQEANRSWLLLL